MQNSDAPKAEAQEKLERKLGEQLAQDSSPESYQKAYDEFHSHLLKYGVRNTSARGYVYKQRLSLFDRRMLSLIGHNKKVLEVGCGEGTLAIACAENGNEVVGLDVSKVMVELAESHKGMLPARFQTGDARYLPFPNGSFDVVVCKDVIEHISRNELDLHLEGVRRVLKENGAYVVYTPSKLLGDLSLGLHLSIYGLAELVPILRKNGFNAQVVCHWLYLPGLPVKIQSSPLVSTLTAYESLIEKAGLGRLVKGWGNWSYAMVPAVWINAVKRSS